MKSGSGTLRPPLLFGLLGLGFVAAAFTVAGPRLLRPTQANPSSLLNAVKSDPAMAEKLCQEFNAINAGGNSVYSTKSLSEIASAKSLSKVASSEGITTADAEILVTYVVGLHCPGVT